MFLRLFMINALRVNHRQCVTYEDVAEFVCRILVEYRGTLVEQLRRYIMIGGIGSGLRKHNLKTILHWNIPVAFVSCFVFDFFAGTDIPVRLAFKLLRSVPGDRVYADGHQTRSLRSTGCCRPAAAISERARAANH